MILIASLPRATFTITIYFGLTKSKVACLDQYGNKDKIFGVLLKMELLRLSSQVSSKKCI